MRTEVLGVEFDNLNMEAAAAKAFELMEQRRSAYVVTPNPEIVWMCRDNSALKESVAEADLVVPDGIGVIYGAKILGTPLQERVPGIDLATKLFERLPESGKTLYLLGAKPGIAEMAAENISKQFPGIKICGTADGYFKDDAPVVEKINAAAPDLLLVCLGAPKQEIWMHSNADKLNVGLMMGLGGVLDVFAGTVQRAPKSWQKLGLEWLYRLIKQPSRIKRMIKLPIFLFAAIGVRIRGKRA
ncbi:MAG: WecB/TagA/CpsF family glycosyltransferase [Oscillospiraceae bacterium]|nr:WecB/TagA/CpsF family glycosyltransferase [Oscillospiraceae bacterium]